LRSKKKWVPVPIVGGRGILGGEKGGWGACKKRTTRKKSHRLGQGQVEGVKKKEVKRSRVLGNLVGQKKVKKFLGKN